MSCIASWSCTDPLRVWLRTRRWTCSSSFSRTYASRSGLRACVPGSSASGQALACHSVCSVEYTAFLDCRRPGSVSSWCHSYCLFCCSAWPLCSLSLGPSFRLARQFSPASFLARFLFPSAGLPLLFSRRFSSLLCAESVSFDSPKCVAVAAPFSFLRVVLAGSSSRARSPGAPSNSSPLDIDRRAKWTATSSSDCTRMVLFLHHIVRIRYFGFGFQVFIPIDSPSSSPIRQLDTCLLLFDRTKHLVGIAASFTFVRVVSCRWPPNGDVRSSGKGPSIWLLGSPPLRSFHR